MILWMIVSTCVAGDHVEADVAYDWTDERAELSPWQWKRTVLELRLSLKRLSMHLEEPDAPTSATSSDEFAATLLDRPLTNDQVALVEEAMKGIDPGAADVVSTGPCRIERSDFVLMTL